MKHPDWPAFLAAIIAEPEDDTRRLAAADFLEENGDADRAAFIRVQIELARLEASKLNAAPEAVELRKRERMFLGPKSEKPHLWAAEECPELVRADPRGRLHFEGTERLTWRRGFIEAVNCPAAEWLYHGVAVRKRNPVAQVILSGCKGITRDAWYAGLAALQGLNRVYLEFFATFDEFNDFREWLRGWLPGTQVEEAIPF